MAVKGIWHFSFTVSDIERSVAFYRDLLGLEVITRQEQANPYTEKLVAMPGANLKVAMLRVPGWPAGPSRHHLELVEYVHPRGVKADVRTNNTGAPHLAFVVDDIHAEYARLLAAGVRFKSDPVEIVAGVNKGGWTIYFLDPDDITLEISQPPPGRPLDFSLLEA